MAQPRARRGLGADRSADDLGEGGGGGAGGGDEDSLDGDAGPGFTAWLGGGLRWCLAPVADLGGALIPG